MGYRYFVTRNGEEREVTVEEYTKTEREAGFRGPGHFLKPPSPATGSFSATMYSNTPHAYTISGREVWEPNDA